MNQNTTSSKFHQLPLSFRKYILKKSKSGKSVCFESKLCLLLNLTTEFEELKEILGAYWIGENIFTINKGILSEILSIEINSLNHNLAQ